MGGTGENSLRQRLRRGRLCVMHSGNVYDVSDFSERHPGGKEWLAKHAGQDVTRVMQDLSGPHRHTKAAYGMLEKYRVSDVSEDSGHRQVTPRHSSTTETPPPPPSTSPPRLETRTHTE